MGYLNSDTITVDAILTKYGRRVLAEGGSLNVSQFALADDGIDYTLYNVDHPSGSANYGDAITALPQLEAVPDNSVMMRYPLNTLDRNVSSMPYITVPASFVIERTGATAKVSPTTHGGFSGESYHLKFTDIGDIHVSTTGGGGAKDTAGTLNKLPTAQEQPYSVLYTGKEFTVSVNKKVTATYTVAATLIGVSSGAQQNVEFEIRKNDHLIG